MWTIAVGDQPPTPGSGVLQSLDLRARSLGASGRSGNPALVEEANRYGAVLWQLRQAERPVACFTLWHPCETSGHRGAWFHALWTLSLLLATGFGTWAVIFRERPRQDLCAAAMRCGAVLWLQPQHISCENWAKVAPRPLWRRYLVRKISADKLSGYRARQLQFSFRGFASLLALLRPSQDTGLRKPIPTESAALKPELDGDEIF